MSDGVEPAHDSVSLSDLDHTVGGEVQKVQVHVSPGQIEEFPEKLRR
jgi:hypothetical protein